MHIIYSTHFGIKSNLNDLFLWFLNFENAPLYFPHIKYIKHVSDGSIREGSLLIEQVENILGGIDELTLKVWKLSINREILLIALNSRIHHVYQFQFFKTTKDVTSVSITLYTTKQNFFTQLLIWFYFKPIVKKRMKKAKKNIQDVFGK